MPVKKKGSPEKIKIVKPPKEEKKEVKEPELDVDMYVEE